MDIVIVVIVLISTYWNVNYGLSSKDKSQPDVLISTYWNVNTNETSGFFTSITVLISTYWNVNPYVLFMSPAVSCFNLNLLECKYTFQNQLIKRRFMF